MDMYWTGNTLLFSNVATEAKSLPTPTVNFINIFCPRFSYKSLFKANFVYCFIVFCFIVKTNFFCLFLESFL